MWIGGFLTSMRFQGFRLPTSFCADQEKFEGIEPIDSMETLRLITVIQAKRFFVRIK